MERYLKSAICADLPTKIGLIMGPRQCGKTTLSKSLYPGEFDYLNYDAQKDKDILEENSWNRNKKLIIFNELHKMRNWKRWLKGIYDTEGIPPLILVTGSAQLNTYRKVGDSLAGRYFQYRLHPLDLKELMTYQNGSAEKWFEQLWQCSGFPEPCLKGSEIFYKRWRSTHLDIILRQDLIDLYTIQDLKSIENLVLLLRKRVGSSISYSHLAQDLQKDIKTIKRWLQILEELYVIYRVTPYSKNIARSLLKEPKFYFYDHNQIENDDGAKLENIVANALLKELERIEDLQGERTALHYLRTKDGKEIDFCVCINDKPKHLIEVKTSNDQLTPAFMHFSKFISEAKYIQLVKNLKREKTYPIKAEIKALVPWLATLDLL